ncbi:MAG: hypothetical protein FWF49_04535 [Oscillospiraceae bacterium]|nr:hypothetical protein [Oscillospiraceae bacterium]
MTASRIYITPAARPPPILREIILKYLDTSPDTVVDLGSETGLSCALWDGVANTVIGIEPNDDMRREAAATFAGRKAAGSVDAITVHGATSTAFSFQKGLSHDTGSPTSARTLSLYHRLSTGWISTAH